MRDDRGTDGKRRPLRLWRPGAERATDEEIRHHLEERVDRLVAEGWDEGAARAEARRRFGDVTRIRREMTAMGRTDEGRRTLTDGLESVVQDVRYALRGLGRNPVFAGALVATLGIGIGASAAIFTVADALMLRPLPYDDPETLVNVGLEISEGTTVPFLFGDQVEPWLEGADFFQAAAYHGDLSLVRTDGPEPETVHALAVTHDLDDLLGAPLRLGRGFTADDAVPGAPGAVVLTHGYWARRGSDPDVLGRTFRLDGESYTVVGVLDRGFKYPVAGTDDIWLPVADDGTVAGRPLGRGEVLGRLRQGVDRAAAQERADALAESLSEQVPHDYGWSVRLGPVGQWRANPDVRRAVWMLTGAVGLMLLIALVNAVNLLLTRGTARVAEMGIRTAVGASRRRLLRQVLTESVVMALLAGGVATLLAWAGLTAVQGVLPDELLFSSVYDFTVEGRTLVFTFALTFAAGLVVGLLPAFQAARRGSTSPTPGRAGTDGTGSGSRLRDVLVAAEVALSVALLAGAGLFVTSLLQLTRVDPGFEPEGLLVADLQLSETRYPSGQERAAFFSRLEERLEALPGVTAAALADGVPPDGGGISFGVRLQAEGSEAPPDQPFWVPQARGGADYLDVLGIDLLAGRPLEAGDAGERNVLIDQPMARFLWGGASPLGRRFRMDDDASWMTVVGVVEDVRLVGVDDRQGRLEIVSALPDTTARSFMSVAVRTDGDPAALAPAVRRTVRGLDAEQPIGDLRPATALLAESIQKPRFLALLMGALAVLALVLAAVGVYGVMAYAVGRRSREVGIRMALGASREKVVGRIFARGMAWAGLGTVAGLGLAVLLDDLAESLLFGIRPGNPAVLAGVAALMLAVAAVACWGPARRATRVDPVEVLRAE